MFDALPLKDSRHSFGHSIGDIRIPITMQEERWRVPGSHKSLRTETVELLRFEERIKTCDFLRPTSGLTAIYIKVYAREDRAF